jgi:hypothetical protein
MISGVARRAQTLPVMMVPQVRPRQAHRRDLPIRAIQDGRPHLWLSVHLMAYRSSPTAPAATRPYALTCRSAQRAFTPTAHITWPGGYPTRGHGACGSGGRRLADPAGPAVKAHDGSYEGIPSPGPAPTARQPVQRPGSGAPRPRRAPSTRRVTHDKYGLGVILSVDDDAVLVNFRPHQRRIALPCAKLTKL